MASPKFDINRLSPTELEYELAIRGITLEGPTSDELLRMTLKNLFKYEREQEGISNPASPFHFEADSLALTTKMAEIGALIEEFDGSNQDVYKTILSKIAHALGRAQRAKASASNKTNKSKLIVDVLNLRSMVDKKVKRHERTLLNRSSGIPDIDLVNEASVDSDSSSENEVAILDLSNSNNNSTSFRNRSIPIIKWNLKKFTGEPNSMSLSAFLELVHETRLARNVSVDDVYRQAIDLFEGRALIWFRANRKYLRDWFSLETRLREEFQPPDYNDKLFAEIKGRTQGSNESVGIYCSIMENLFNRLTIKIPESTRLKIIINNLSPFYQTSLALHEIGTIEELIKLGRMLEARKSSVEAFRPPVTRNRHSQRCLEPDLAYVYSMNGREPPTSSVTAINSPVRNNRGDMRCFNCNQLGHLVAQCPQPYRKVCYKCRKPNYTTKTCPDCNRFSGNGPRRN